MPFGHAAHDDLPDGPDHRAHGLSFYGTISAITIGLTLMVGAVAIVAVRSYITIGERFADMTGTEPDSTPAGAWGIALELAAGPGIHRPLGLSGVVIFIFGIIAAIVGIALRITRKRRLARNMAEFAEATRQQRINGR
jgi:hypothetical protein